MPNINTLGSTSISANSMPEHVQSKNAKKGLRKIAIINPFKWISNKKPSHAPASKTFTKNSWQVKNAPVRSGASVRQAPAKTRQNSQEVYFKGFKKYLGALKTGPEIERFKQSVLLEKTKGNLSAHKSDELISLANLRKTDFSMAKKHEPEAGKKVFGNMMEKASAMTTLEQAVELKRSMLTNLVNNGISSAEHSRVQNKMTQQLKILATNNQQAKRMNVELLKKLTGDTSVARDIQKIVDKSLTGELEQRLQNLRKS